MNVSFEVNLDKFRYSLVGDGYIYDEVVAMSEDKLLYLLEKRIHDYIETEYDRSLPIIKDVIDSRVVPQ